MSRSAWRFALPAAAGYLLLYLAWTFPLVTRFGSAFPAEPGNDAFVYLWNVWHLREAVVSGHNPLSTDWVLYPWGASLLLHAYTPILGLLNLPLGNAALAINLGLALSYALSGTGAAQLSRRWVRSPLLNLLSGLVFAFSPYKLLRLAGHYNLVLTATVPFYVMAFLDAFEWTPGRFWPRVRSWRAVGWCFALGFITLLSDYYVLFGLIYFSLGYALWFWLKLGQINWRGWRAWAGLAGLLGVSHVVIRLLRLAGLPDNAGFWWGGDVAGYLLPINSRWLETAAARAVFHDPNVFRTPGSIENVMFLGYALPVLALLLALWPGRPVSARRLDAAGRPLAWLLLLFVLLTLPELRVFGKRLLNLPTGALHFVPFFNNVRCPTRWVLFVSLLLPIVTFAALEARWQLGRWPRAALQGLSTGLLALVLLEFWPRPVPLSGAATIPEADRVAATLPGRVLLPLPLGLQDGYSLKGIMEPENLYYQSAHRKKLPLAYLSRVSPERFARFDADPVLRTLLRLQKAPNDTVVAPPTAAQAAAFRRLYQPDVVIVRPSLRDKAVLGYLRPVLPGYQERRFADGSVLLWDPAGK
ncbi:hypothetical protein [Hymenobacter sp. B81]|uniref:hypothetical protein n=1 Tax=Hymenobacter sp. B81 TaxID=3344878 RepID=UPI0037DD485F